jgi:hypothetical protein
LGFWYGQWIKHGSNMDQTWIKHIQAERCPMMALRLAGDRSRLCLTDPMASPRSNLDDAMTNFVQSRSRLDNLPFPNWRQSLNDVNDHPPFSYWHVSLSIYSIIIVHHISSCVIIHDHMYIYNICIRQMPGLCPEPQPLLIFPIECRV